MATPEAGLASRVGGDEFYMYVPNVDADDIVAFVERLQLLLTERPFPLGRETIPIRASIGVSVAPDQGADLDTLIHKADQAMYQIKQHGKNDYAIYDEVLHGPK